MIGWDQGLCLFKKRCLSCLRCRVFLHPKNPSEYAENISVHHGDGFFERKGRNRGGSVWSHTGKFLELGESRRKLAMIVSHHHLGALQEVSGTRVVTQSLPKSQNLALGRLRKGLHLGIALNKS